MERPSPNGLDPMNLFCDAESRDVNNNDKLHENEIEARALAMQTHLCQYINLLQTSSFKRADDASPTSTPNAAARLPPEVPPVSLVVPRGQTVAQPAVAAQSRGDLAELSRLTSESTCMAFSLPQSVVLEGAARRPPAPAPARPPPPAAQVVSPAPRHTS